MINVKNTLKKIKYIFRVLKCAVVCLFYMTFYNLQNSEKLLPKMQKRTVQGGARYGSWALGALFFAPPNFLTLAPSLLLMSAPLDLLYGTCKINGSVLFYYDCF